MQAERVRFAITAALQNNGTVAFQAMRKFWGTHGAKAAVVFKRNHTLKTGRGVTTRHESTTRATAHHTIVDGVPARTRLGAFKAKQGVFGRWVRQGFHGGWFWGNGSNFSITWQRLLRLVWNTAV